MSDSEQLRLAYEGVVKQNPSNVEAVHYLAVWHLERHSFQQVPSAQLSECRRFLSTPLSLFS